MAEAVAALLTGASAAAAARAEELGLAALPASEPLVFEDSAIATAQAALAKRLREAASSAQQQGGAAAAKAKAAGFGGADLAALLRNASTFEATAKFICWQGLLGQQIGELSVAHKYHLIGPAIFFDFMAARHPGGDVVHDVRFLLSLQLASRTMIARAKAEAVTPKPALDRILLREAAELIPLLTEQIDFVLPFDSQSFFAEFAPPASGAAPGAAPAQHVGIACGGCLVEPIVGARWTCAVCSWLSLCPSCYESKPLLPSGARIHDRSKHEARRYDTPLPRKELPTWFLSLENIIRSISDAISRALSLLAALPPALAPSSADGGPPPRPTDLDAPVTREEIEAVMCLARDGRFISALKSSLLIFVDFATNAAQFDCVLFLRTGAVTSAVGLLQVLVSDALFVDSLTADKSTVRFLLQTLCQPASMRDNDINLALQGLRVLIDIVTANGQAERLVREHDALTWLSPLVHHARPMVALHASILIAMIVHQLPGEAMTASVDEVRSRAVFAARTFGPEHSRLTNLSARGIRLLADMATSREGAGPLAVVGLSALAQLAQGAVAGADWPVLQQLGPAFFRTLASLASSLGAPLKAKSSIQILKALGHALPPLAVPVSGALKDRRARASELSYIGLGALRRPATMWDADDVTLWASVQPFREHAPLFRAAWLNGRVLLSLDDADLVAMGVARPVHRKAILVAIERLRAATERALARRSASGGSGLMSPTPDALGSAASEGAAHALDDGSLDLHALGVKRASGRAAAADGGSADVFLCTPCEGGAGVATFLGAQLRDLGLVICGHNTAHSEHASAGVLARGNIDFAALGYAEAGGDAAGANAGAHAPDGGAAAVPDVPALSDAAASAAKERAFGVDAAQIAAEVQASAIVVVFLARRTLSLGAAVGATAAALPSCLPARLHAQLRAEVAAALRAGRPIFAVALSGFEWPKDAATLPPELRDLRDAVDPPPAAADVAPAGIPAAAAAAAAAAATAGAAAAAAPPAAAAAAAAPAPPAATSVADKGASAAAALALPKPTPRGGVLVRLTATQLVVPDRRLAQAIAAHAAQYAV
jgi:hypothetical protein